MSTQSLFGDTQEERNIYFNRAVPYLNQPAVGTNPSTATRLGITAANLAILNKLYSNPNPVGVTVPDNLGYLELWPLHTSPGGKHDPTITHLFHQIERRQKAGEPLGLEDQLRIIFGDIPESALTATDRTALNLHQKKAATTTTISTEATGKLLPMYLSLKKQIHLSVEIEVTYPGTTSKAKRKGVKEAMVFILIQAANLTTTPDPAAKNSGYTYLGDLVYGTLTANFTESEEGMAALFYMQEKSKGKKAVLGTPTKVFRVVIS
jgi:hypothetical protein